MLERAEIWVKAGDGGDGAVSFRREKFIPYGGPDGGDGGKGGGVSLRADSNVNTLQQFQYQRRFKAEGGGRGAGKKKHGKTGDDLVILVPLGTEVYQKNKEGKELLVDLEREGQSIVVARGGRGGRGNVQFATSTYQTPRFAQRGEVGEEAELLLELKLIADIAIVGFPSVGKSTLLSAVSGARPKIGDYPFTTKEPVLGVGEAEGRRFIAVEIPGLIEGAHLGRGLGHEFLRHSERTRLFIHLLEGTSPHPGEDWMKVNQELLLYSPALAKKPQVIAVNKIDLPEVRTRVPELKSELSQIGLPLFFISAATKEGVAELMAKAARLVEASKGEGQVLPTPEKVFRPQPRPGIEVIQEAGGFRIVSSRLERLVSTLDWDNGEAQYYIKKQMQRWGAVKALQRAGVKPGDKVRLGKIEWEWQPTE